MPEIADIMDVNIEDLSPEQRQQLQDAMDQFQQKCLLSFNKNRSGIPYLKNEMPRVLLPGESDATVQQEKEECMRVFQESADYMLSKHNKAFLGALQQMMVAVFGPSMEQAFSKAPVQGGTVELAESSSQPPLRSQPMQPPPQSAGSQAFQPPLQGAGKQPVQPPLQASGGQPIQPPPQGSTGQPVQQPNPFQPTYVDVAFGSPGAPFASG
jgi:hypothetical protein